MFSHWHCFSVFSFFLLPPLHPWPLGYVPPAFSTSFLFFFLFSLIPPFPPILFSFNISLFTYLNNTSNPSFLSSFLPASLPFYFLSFLLSSFIAVMDYTYHPVLIFPAMGACCTIKLKMIYIKYVIYPLDFFHYWMLERYIYCPRSGKFGCD